MFKISYGCNDNINITFITTQQAASAAKGKRSVFVRFCIVCNNTDTISPINNGTFTTSADKKSNSAAQV